MIEYNKIETVSKRSMDGNKKLLQWEFRNPTVEYLQNNIWQFTEKIDRTNIRVYWDGHEVTFGGSTNKAQIPSHLMNYLISVFKNDEAEQIFEEKFGETPVIIFGEGYGGEIQNGVGYRSDVSFIVFDVLIIDTYQPRSSVEDIARSFGVDVVPLIFEGTLDDGINFVKKHPDSTIGHAKMEGLVARPKIEMRDRCGERVIVKNKWSDFKEFAEQSWCPRKGE